MSVPDAKPQSQQHGDGPEEPQSQQQSGSSDTYPAKPRGEQKQYGGYPDAASL